MKLIIYTRPDGGLSIVHPTININDVDGFSEAMAEQRAFERLPSDAINPRFVDEVPADRTFRNAWKQNVDVVEHDMPKCREIHRNSLRELRKPLLEVLDAAYLRADELGDLAEKARIVARKQALRDVTDDPAIDAAKTPEALAAVIPVVLR